MLKLENVSKSYAKGKVKAVDSVSFEARPGEIFGFLGPNGAGKTTTIKMICGILSPRQRAYYHKRARYVLPAP